MSTNVTRGRRGRPRSERMRQIADQIIASLSNYAGPDACTIPGSLTRHGGATTPTPICMRQERRDARSIGAGKPATPPPRAIRNGGLDHASDPIGATRE